MTLFSTMGAFDLDDPDDDANLAGAAYALTPLRRSVDARADLPGVTDGSTAECCACCEECCCASCGCERCCERCRARCRCAFCRKCCTCRCSRTSQDLRLPIDITWKYGLRHVADENVVLGCFSQYRTFPSCGERWFLLLLFLATAVFVQYAEEAIGPICIREYLGQCPPFTAVARHGLPMTYIRQAPPDVNVPEGVNIQNRRLDVQYMGAAVRKLQSDAGNLALSGNDKSKAERVRESLISRLSLMFGSWQYDCNKPMCDIFYPQMIDWFSLWRLTNKIWGTSTSHSIPFTSEAAIIGYCKCDGPLFDGVIHAKVSGEARSFIITLLVQTLLPKLFRLAFYCMSTADHDGDRIAGEIASAGRCVSVRCAKRCGFITKAMLVATVVSMALSVFLLKFDPQGWRNALLVSAISAAALDPCLTLLQMLICVKAGWPLRRCGCGAPVDELPDYPQVCGRRWSMLPRAFNDVTEPEPSRMGKADE